MLRQGFNRLNSLDQPSADATVTERDFKNTMYILDFCIKHDFFPSMELIKDLTNELLKDYDKNAYKLRPENQEFFIKIGKIVYKNDPKRLEKTAEASIRFIKTEATSLKYLCNGLEVFEVLDIVKHESRRLLLGKIKNAITNEEFKIKELMYLIQLYPNKIKTKAYEQLVDLALQKVLDRNLLPNME